MFKLSLQFARHEVSESQDSEVSAADALTAFDEFDWAAEVRASIEIQKCSPTVSLQSGERVIWLSGVGDPDAPDFISECGFPGVVKKWFGLSKGPGLVALYLSLIHI